MDKKDLEMLGTVITNVANAIVLLARVVSRTPLDPTGARQLADKTTFKAPRKTGAGDWNY